MRSTNFSRRRSAGRPLHSVRTRPSFSRRTPCSWIPRTERLCKALAEKAQAAFGKIDAVVSPAVGAIIPGYETARRISARARCSLSANRALFQLRRGFEIKRGERVLMVEDVVTTGLSSRECLDAIRGHPGELVGAACLIDRSGGKADIGATLVSLAAVTAPAYPADQLPPDLAAPQP
ncbi:MAG: phosphoribosyltransferase family protein [Hyphomonadaceae bacterium]